MNFFNSSTKSFVGDLFNNDTFRNTEENNLNLDGENDLDLGLSDNVHDESSPLLLDTIETSFSDPKNLNKVIEELASSEIRWFYKNLTNKRWLEFNGFDSLQLETSYREIYPEWRYYNAAYRSTSTEEVKTQNVPSHDAMNEPSDKINSNPGISDSFDNPNNNARIVVRGGLYEVDLHFRKCYSIYWPGEESVITRGSWFYETNWQPLDEEQSNTLEIVHLANFLGRKCADYVQDTKPPKRVHSEVFADSNVDWYSPTEIYLYSQATPSKIVRSFTQRLGGYFHKSTGSRLLRGYKHAATDDDRPTDITHIVFVVHGIGQKMDIGGRILQNTSLIRDCVTTLQQKFFPDSKHRAAFFPVEWRTSLTLDGGMVEAITPLNVMPLRQLLNASAMDIMYYTSPIYCAEIQQGLCEELNRLHSLFVDRNPPHPSTKFSVIAHSLGAVIVYDIVTGWRPSGPLANSHNGEMIIPGKSRLNFHLDNFFCLGSPLSVFLALRVPKGQHGYHLFPPSLCNRLYNIFHLSDPVAYRLEPLVVRDYARISPLLIQPYNSPGTRHSYSEMPLELIVPLDNTTASSPVTSPDRDQREDPLPAPPLPPTTNISPADTPTRDRGWSLWGLVRGGVTNKSQDDSPQLMDSPTQGLEHRLDYILKAAMGGSAASYFFTVTSHTAYWNNHDVAFFVLTRLFPELEQQGEERTSRANAPSPTLDA